VAEAVASIQLLRPVRVLIAGDDGDAVDQLRDELVRLGFHTMSTTRLDRVPELAAAERVNVVVLEFSGGIASAASVASSIEALPQRVEVVLAGHRGKAARRLGYEVVDPGGSAEELAAAIHRAYRGGPTVAGRSARS
jgi:DNA-binding NtrC family response regulator